MTLLGELSLWVALVMAAWGTVVSFAGGALRHHGLAASGERAIHATVALLVIASVGLASALLHSDFSLRYVALHTSSNLPTPYKLSAFWAGPSGALLLWALMVSACAAIAVRLDRDRQPAHAPWVAGTLSAVTLLTLIAIAFASNPYQRLTWMPLEGLGLHPALQSPGAVIHPPNLYLGYAATAVPLALGVAALVTRRLDAEWLGSVRRWTLVAWCVLTIGILLGMWSGYLERGGSGAWTRSAVENASLLPWLAGTALLHSIVIQEKRALLARWNVTLAMVTFLLAAFAMIFARAGSGPPLVSMPAVFWAAGFLVMGAVAAALLVAGRLRGRSAAWELESAVSREGGLLSSNVVLAGIALAVLAGTLAPVVGEALRRTTIAGAGFFDEVIVLLGLVLLALTGIGSLMPWRRAAMSSLRPQLSGAIAAGIATGAALFALGVRDAYALIGFALTAFVLGTIVQEFVNGMRARRTLKGEASAVALLRLVSHHRRRYGGYIAHAGVVLLFAAFAGLALKTQFDASLSPGESFTAVDPFGRRWTFASNGVSRFQQLNRHVTAVALVSRPDGGRPHLITSETRQYIDGRGASTFEPTTEAGVLETWRQDVYVTLTSIAADERVEIRITFNPLVRWIWIGGAVMLLGGLIVMWPAGARPRIRHGQASERDPAGVPPVDAALRPR